MKTLCQKSKSPRVALFSAGSWYFRPTARVLQDLDALAGLYISDKNTTGIKKEFFHRCLRFHMTMKPFYHFLDKPVQRWTPLFYMAFPIWRQWVLRQNIENANVVQAIGPFAKEAFDLAERYGRCLKVFDAPNSHPRTQRALLKNEYDRWAPGLRTPRELDWYIKRADEDLQRADIILCPSLFVKESMLRQGIPEAKLALVPFGVDKTIFQPVLQPPDQPTFIAVGTICLRKGYQYLFRAFALVKKRRPDARLIVVGNYRPDFQQERQSLDPSITILHQLSHKQISELFKTCTAFVIPSVEEGYARVILEALSAGLPVIGTHESGATTDIQDNKQGLIVPRCDVESLADAMLQLACNPPLAAAMRNAAATYDGRDISWNAYGDQLHGLYVDHLQRKGIS